MGSPQAPHSTSSMSLPSKVGMTALHGLLLCCRLTEGSKRAFGATFCSPPASGPVYIFISHGRLVAPKICTAGWQTGPVHGRLELLARPAGGPSTTKVRP